jgi:ligand-binding sensor domain-containing protein
MIRRRFAFVPLFCAVAAFSQYQIPDRELQYRPGDWVSYPVLRFVSSLALDQSTVYAGTTGGISRYNFFQKEWDVPFTWSDGIDGHQVRAIAYDFDSGTLWCATEHGVNYKIPGAEQWRQISYPDAGLTPVSAIGIGRNFVWLKSGDAFFKTEHTGDRFTRASEDDANQDGALWRGGSAGSLPQLFMEKGCLFDPTGTIMDTELRRYDVTASLQDEFRNLWIGTRGLGMGWSDLNTLRLQMLPYGPYQPDIHAMAWDVDGMWIGGLHTAEEEGGFTHWNMDRGEWDYFQARYNPLIRSDQVTDIAVGGDAVWFGTTEGLVRYDKKTNGWNYLTVRDNLWSDRINRIALSDSGELWIATRYGVNRIRLPGMIVDQMRDARLNNRCIHDIKTDGNWVWAATDRGIYRYSRSQNEWAYVSGYPGILAQQVFAVSVCGDEVWFATDDGVEVYDKELDRWQGFSKNQYPTEGPINTILADSAAVWVGTEGRGVLKYLKSENRWRTFTTGDGLLDNSVRAILINGDTVWFGTAKGVTRFYWNAPYRRD